jgi:hypothetical protein
MRKKITDSHFLLIGQLGNCIFKFFFPVLGILSASFDIPVPVGLASRLPMPSELSSYQSA